MLYKSMINIKKYILVTLLTVIPFFSAHAQEEGNNGPYVKIRLVPEHSTIKPGDDITIAIEQTIAPGWHTYWKNPGDSGAAPRINWKLPEGFTAGEIEWPVPHKIPMGPLVNYGYENEVILLQTLKIPATIADGSLTLAADIDILVCKEICIPESGTYEITLNNPEITTDNTPYIKKARALTPVPSAASGTYTEKDGFFILEKPIDWSHTASRYDFIPEDWGLIENGAPPEISQNGSKIRIRQKRGERSISELSEIRGLLLWHAVEGDHAKAYAFSAKSESASEGAGNLPAKAAPTLLAALGLAILGGLILNLMPCVFPVLSIKALSLVKIAEKEPGAARLHGIAYTTGVIACFILIASILIALKSGGEEIGWGFQLQNPRIVAGLAYLFFILGLNFSGVFEIGNHFGNLGNRLTQGNTPVHSFFTGALATLVATPCTAPFMGVALGFALVQPTFIGLSVFAALGLGLSLPYLALSFIPALQRTLPKPGAWMEIFRQALAFPMYASAAWLVWVLSQQTGAIGVGTSLTGLVLIGFAIWLLRHAPAARKWRYAVRIIAILSLVSAVWVIPGGIQKTDAEKPTFGEIYSPEKLSNLLEGNAPVFVEMTAAWCITCKVNHALAIDIVLTRKLFSDNNIIYLIGDWTNQDPQITEYLAGYGRSGVPIYVYYGPRDANGTRPEPVVLPQILTPGTVAKVIKGY